LDEVEEKERLDELGDESGKSKAAKGGKLALGKKKPLMAADSLPSPAARRVIPKIDAEMLKKEEKLIAAKENKGKRAEKKVLTLVYFSYIFFFLKMFNLLCI